MGCAEWWGACIEGVGQGTGVKEEKWRKKRMRRKEIY
jgi:hypothetical protein